MFRQAYAVALLFVITIPLRADPPVDKLPPGAIARLGSYRFYHGGCIESTAISPNGKFIATVGRRPTGPGEGVQSKVCLWDAVTGEEKWGLPVKERFARTLTFSHDGTKLALTAGEKILVLDATTGKVLRTLPGTHYLCQLIFSNDDQELILIAPESAVWFDLTTGKTIHERSAWPNGKPMDLAEEKQERCFGIALSADHKVLACALSRRVKVENGGSNYTTDGPGPLRIVDVETGRILQQADSGRRYDSLAFTLDGARIVAISNHGAWLLNAADGQEIANLQKSKAPVRGLALLNDGRTLLATTSEGAALFKATTGQKTSDVPGNIGAHGFVLSPDERYAAWYSSDEKNDTGPILHVSEIRTGRHLWQRDLKYLLDDTNPIDLVPHFFPDGKTIAVSQTSWVTFFDTLTGKEPLAETGQMCEVLDLQFQNNGREVKLITFRHEFIWDIVSRQIKKCNILDGWPKPIHDSSDDCKSRDHRFRLVIAKDAMSATIYEAASDLLFMKLQGHRKTFQCAEFSPDGRTVATGGEDGVVFLWDIEIPMKAHRPNLGAAAPDSAALWKDLSDDDAPKAWAAICMLAESKESVQLLRERLIPVRSQTTEEALSPTLSGDRLRQWRAVALLERIGTPDAVKLLEVLAGGLPEARLTVAAKDALARLRSR
jgi:WD40 repeat protein